MCKLTLESTIDWLGPQPPYCKLYGLTDLDYYTPPQLTLDSTIKAFIVENKYALIIPD
jgi:hypothetical protein